MDQKPSGLTPRDYEFALLVQSACNLSGVVHSFHEIVTRVWEDARKFGKGTDWVNHHPICVLFAEQIAFLSGGMGASNEDWRRAYKDCERGAWGEPLEYYKDAGEQNDEKSVSDDRTCCGGTACCGDHCSDSNDRIANCGRGTD